MLATRALDRVKNPGENHCEFKGVIRADAPNGRLHRVAGALDIFFRNTDCFLGATMPLHKTGHKTEVHRLTGFSSISFLFFFSNAFDLCR